MVTLDDGSMGMLPEDWLKKYGMLAELGDPRWRPNGPIRFGKAQAGLLDALLASQPEIKLDIGFGKVRQALPRFDGVHPKEAPAGLPRRAPALPVRRAWAGWNTSRSSTSAGSWPTTWAWARPIQVLALLQSRRARRQSRRGPSLDRRPPVAGVQLEGRSRRSSARGSGSSTTPAPTATRSRDELRADFDLIITTYGTLRTDIVDLSQITFDYVILDEAQAIKNADSQAAKAARVLKGRHRLAMSRHADREPPGRALVDLRVPQSWDAGHGLGVQEARLGGLRPPTKGPARSWPGRSARSSSGGPRPRSSSDLPEKFEQTLVCDLEPAQRQMYEGPQGPLPPGPVAQGHRRAGPVQDRGPGGPA